MKENITKLLKGSLIYGIGSALTQLLNLLLMPSFTSYLFEIDYGIIAILTMLSLFLTTIFSFGFGTAIGLNYFEKDDLEHRKKVINSSVFFLLFSNLIMLVIGYLFSEKFSLLLFDSYIYSNFIFITFFSAAVANITLPLILSLQFEQKQIQYVVVTLIFAIFSIGIRVYLVIYQNAGIGGMIYGNFYSTIVLLFLSSIVNIPNLKLVFDINQILKLIKYGIPLLPSFFALYIIQQGNIFLLNEFTSKEEIGLYSMGLTFGSIIMLIISAFATAWFPFFMSFTNKQKEASILFGKITTYYVLGIGSISCFFYLFSVPAIRLFTQAHMWESYQLIGLSSTAFSIMGLFNLLLPPLYFAKKVNYVSLIQIISAAIYLIAAFFLIQFLGKLGAGIALIIGYLSISVLSFLSTKNKEKYFQIKYEKKRIAIFGVFYILCSSFALFLNFHWDFTLWLISTFFLVFLLLTIILKLITYEEKQIIYKAFKIKMSTR